MKITDIIMEAANPAQQAAIAIAMKKAGKKPQSEGVAEGAEFGAYYSEQVAQQIFNRRPDITSEDEVLNQAYHIVANDQGQRRARYMFNYDEDFASDLVSNYFHLQRQGVAEGQLDEISQDTARSYAQKATQSRKDLANQTYRKGADTDKLNKKIQNRQAGLNRAHTDKRYYKDELGVAEGLMKDIKRLATGKDVNSRTKQEITKAQQASMTGDNKTAHKHFKRYDKLDKLANKEQGVAEGFSDIVKGVKRKVAGKMSAKDTEQFYASKAKRSIDDANKLNNQAAYDDEKKQVDRYNKVSKVVNKEGVAEGINDTIYPNAEVIKSKNGRPIGEIYQDGNSWGCFHYRADRGYDMIDSRADAIQDLKDLHNETLGRRPDYTIKGVAEGLSKSPVCKHCGKKQGEHRRGECPKGSKTAVGYTDYGPTKFEPKEPKKQGVAEGLSEEFDLIESIVEMIAEHNGVDADVVWEDLESLTEDELYVFAVTSDPLMEDWQKANKRDKTDGMSQKAVNAYRREHPGSKLKTAVTTKPSKLKKGGKASKRRKSYCSRSRGQMKMHSISCAKTPDKAICKARRRWNC